MDPKDLFFPKKCLGCGRWGEYFCADCLNYILLKESRICPVCLKNSYGGKTHPGCQRQGPRSLNGLTSVFSYKGIIEKAIKKLKYRFVSSIAYDLIELFFSIAGEDKYFVKFARQKGVILVPVPLHPRRFRWRGFNQAELLGKMIADNLEICFMPDLLKRIKRTKPQTELKKKKRLENVKNAFEFNSKKYPSILVRRLADLNILIFDDLFTTGATLKECCRILKKSGIKNVWGLTLAR